jgi:hypothetical protein
VFWFIPVSITITNKNINQPNGILPYDIYGGGLQRTNPNQIPLSGITSNAFGFIPTASALDVGSSTTLLNDFDYRNSYVGALPPPAPKNTQFNNFVTHFNRFNPNDNNSPHITFNRRNGNWLRTELDVNIVPEVVDCSAFCINAELIGEDYLCTTETYSVTNEATFTNWTVNDPNNLVTFTTSGNDITLNQINQTQNGTITLSAFYGNGRCGNITVAKDIWVGNPNVTTNGINGGYDNASTNSTTQFSVAWATGNTHYYWSVTPNTTCNAGSGPTIQPTSQNTYNSTSRYASINWGACTGTYSVVCYAKNDCGLTYIGQKWVTVYDPYDDNPNDPCDDLWSLKSYPNPIKGGSIIVNKLPPGNPCDDDPYGGLAKQVDIRNDVKIYDFYGNVVYENNFNSNEFNINGLKLRTGHYILNVQSSDGQILRKLITAE